MPRRKFALVNDHYYHVYNRTVNRQPCFNTDQDYNHAIYSLWYYNFADNHVSLSTLHQKLSPDFREDFIQKLIDTDNYYVDVISFVLMPNHYHLVVKQNINMGISKFIGNFQNSYTRTFNKKYGLKGGFFMPRFKAKPIETDEQLLHTTRYVHLNPLTSGITKSIEALAEYPYSSYPQYSGERDAMWSVNKDVILDFYKNSQNPQGEYLKFVKDQVGYQRELHKIKHLLFE